MWKIGFPPHPSPLPPGEREGIETIRLTLLSPLRGEGDGGGEPLHFVKNSRGISVLFLVIAMLLMVTIGYVFSYLIPSKQKSVALSIQSTQAFFIAQSGVEFAVRYATDNSWTTTALLNNLNSVTRSLGTGRFILTYNYATYGDTLISVGEVPTNTPRRSIRVSNFISFLTQGLIIDPGSPAPYWTTPNQVVRFYIKNVSGSSITLTAFTATWSQSSATRLREIRMDGVQKFWGNYWSNDPIQNFNRGGNSQTILPNQVVQVDITWFNNTVTGNIVIIFYTAAMQDYTFTLNPI